MSFVAKVIASAGDLRIDSIRKSSVGSEMDVVLIEGESGFEKLASREVVLIFEAGDVAENWQ